MYRGGAEVTIASFSSPTARVLNRGETRPSCLTVLEPTTRMKWYCCFIAFPLVANSTLELWRAKPTGKLRVGRTCQKTRRNHSRHCKFSLSTILHASPAVGVEASQQLEPPALTSPCIRRLDDAEVRRRS